MSFNAAIEKIYAYSMHEGLESQGICNQLRELVHRDSISKEEYMTALTNLSKVTSERSALETAIIRDALKLLSKDKPKAQSSEPVVVLK